MTTFETALSIAQERHDARSHDEYAQAGAEAPTAYALCTCIDGAHTLPDRATPWVTSPDIAWRDHIYYPPGMAHEIIRTIQVESWPMGDTLVAEIVAGPDPLVQAEVLLGAVCAALPQITIGGAS